MRRPPRFSLLLLAALVLALAYLGGVLAPPLHSAGSAGPAAPEITLNEWGAVQAAMDLLLDGGDFDNFGYLPFIRG